MDEDSLAIDQDAFGRQDFVGRCVAALDAVRTSQQSAVLGLVGAWGSGKTQTLRWVRDRLEARPRDWHVVEMGAWAVAGPDGVTLELLRTLAAALGGGRWSRTTRSLRRIARAAVPVAAPAATLLAGVHALGWVGPVLAKLGWKDLLPVPAAAPVPAQVAALARRTAKRPQATLVVVDDVDRLQPEELLALMKAVRVLGRLPRVHYLLVYDEDTLLHLMSQTPVGSDPDRAVAYLDKVVTLRLDQPPASRQDAERALHAELGQALADCGVTVGSGQRTRWDAEVSATFAVLLPTLRSAQRLASQLRALLPLVTAEAVDPTDFAVLTLLRSRHPALYAQLARDRYVLAGRRDGPSVDATLSGWQGGTYFGVAPTKQQYVLRSAVGRMFPLSLDPNSPQAAHVVLDTALRAPRRATNRDYVDRYFELAAPTPDSDDALVARALAEWSGTSNRRRAWSEVRAAVRNAPAGAASAQRAARVLRACQAATEAGGPPVQAAGLQMALQVQPDAHHGDQRSTHRGIDRGGDSAEQDGLTGAPAEALAEVSAEATTWLRLALAPATLDADGVVALARQQPEEAGAAPAAARLLALHRALCAGPVGGAPSSYDASLHARAGEAAWQVCEDTARRASALRGASGMLLPTAALLRAVDELAPRLLDAVVPAALDAGVGLLELAACWFDDAGASTGAYEREQAETVVRLMGLRRVDAAVMAPAPAQAADEPSEPGETGEESAARPEGEHFTELSDWLDQRGGVYGIAADSLALVVSRPAEAVRLPRGVQPVPGGVQPHAELLHQLGAQSPDVQITASLHLPAAQGPAAPEASEKDWQRVVNTLTTGDPVERWLRAAAPAWSAHPEVWSAVQDRPRRPRQLLTGLRTAEERSGDPYLQRPVHVVAQVAHVLPGDVSSAPGLRLSIDAGLWLTRLNEHRLLGGNVESSAPLPAALHAAEAREMVEALLGWLACGALNAQPLAADLEPGADAWLQVRLSGRMTLRQAVRLEGASWGAGSGIANVAYKVDCAQASLQIMAQDPSRVAQYFLDHWLAQSGAQRPVHWPP